MLSFAGKQRSSQEGASGKQARAKHGAVSSSDRGLLPHPQHSISDQPTRWTLRGVPYAFETAPNPSLPIQTKLTVNVPGDAYEHEADQIADQVMSMPEPGRLAGSISSSAPGVQRRCACGGGCPRCQSTSEHHDEQVQMKPAASRPGGVAPTPVEAPPIVHEVLRSPGQPLDAATRAFMEPRFGRDLGDVRTHSDHRAAESASSVKARAYTTGRNIVFGDGQFRPGTYEGRELIAHELAHVAQQRSGPQRLARRTDQYETQGVAVDQNTMDQVATVGYWLRKFQDAHVATSLDQRLALAGEEQEAVIAAVWQIKPALPFARESTRIIRVPHRSGAPQSQDVTYQVIFKAATSGNQGTIIVNFVGAGAEGTAVVPGAAPSSYSSNRVALHPDTSSFPGGAAQYFQAHPDEQLRISYWIEKTAPRQFNQLLTITAGANSVSFQVTGTKNAAGNATANITFLGALASTVQAPPAHYADQALEDLKNIDDPLLSDRLHSISGLNRVPADELASVKFIMAGYFKSTPVDAQHPKARKGTRNAEVDAIVPIYGTQRRVLYTFRFNESNDVEIERIGEEGRDVSLAPKGSLTRVNGFTDHSRGGAESDRVSGLINWLRVRYKGLPLPTVTASTTVADVERDVTGKIQATKTKQEWIDWYQKNYGIVIVPGAGAAAWLSSIGIKEAEAHQDLKDFSDAELPILELVLERMSDSTLQKFKDLHMLRQNVYCKWIPRSGSTPGHCEFQSDIAGVTVGGRAHPTITIFDQAWANVGQLFLGGNLPGGGREVETEPAETFAHELGHVVSYSGSVKEDFDKLVFVDPKHDPPQLKTQFKAITWYAADKPLNEFFAETFALYYSDPIWLHDNWLDLFTFFDTLDKTAPSTSAKRRP